MVAFVLSNPTRGHLIATHLLNKSSRYPVLTTSYLEAVIGQI